MSLIRNSKQTKQGVDFTGLQNGNIHPTDIDAVLEFDNKLLVLFEMKRKGNQIPLGQKILLERVCNNWSLNGKIAFAIKIEHEFYNDDVDVPIEKCKATEFYNVHTRKWHKTKKENIIDILNILGDKYNIKKIKF